jgi:hypothetical protein
MVRAKKPCAFQSGKGAVAPGQRGRRLALPADGTWEKPNEGRNAASANYGFR